MTTNVPSIQLTSVGYVAPPGPSVLAGVQADISAAFGKTLNFNLNTPQGQISSSLAASINNANQIFVYFSQQVDPAYSSGRFQDAIGRLYFMTRNPAQPTALQINCTGAGVTIPIGALISDKAGNLYQCTQAGTLPPGGGTIVLSFAAQIPGPTPVPDSGNVSIYQAIPGWDTVSVASGVVGSNVESRAAFEIRRADSVSSNSFGATGSIIGAVAAVPGVLDYYGYNNNTSSAVTIGGVTIPAYSIYICVAGGSPTAIAQAILSKKSAGAPMAGNTTVTAYDSNPLYAQPIPYSITFQIPSAIQVLFKVVIASGPTVPTNAVTLVQNALLAAFQGASLQASFTGSINGTILTVSAVQSGTIAIGQRLSDLTGQLLANTTIVANGTGVGGVGTYQISRSQTVISEQMTSASPSTAIKRARIGSTLYAVQYVPAIAALGTWAQVSQIGIGSANTPDATFYGYIQGNTLTVVSMTSGTIQVSQTISDANNLIINATQITIFGTGSGGVGTYTINNPQTIGATFTGTGSGTNLTASAVTGTIAVGDLIAGTGVPGGTTIVSQTSGTPGGAGVYVTSNATTSSGAALSASIAISSASADQQVISIRANQIPQLYAPNIAVTTS